MKGVVFSQANRAEYIEKDMPTCEKGKVLVKLLRVGVCGTDIQVFMGRNKFMSFPVVPFHEGVGRIHELSEEGDGLQKGDLVTIRPIINCQKCRACMIGSHNACENFNCLGVQSDGLGDEYFAIDRRFIHKLDENIRLDAAVLIEPFAVGVHSARRSNPKGKNVFVIGGGTIGNFVAQACVLYGAKRTAICDISEKKISLAEKSGINCAVNTSDLALEDAIQQAFDGAQADIIIDCVGAKAMLPSILEAACKASTLVIVGNYSEPVEIDITKIQRNELDVYGCITYTKADFEQAIKWMEEGKVYTEGFITGRFPLSEIQNGMEQAVKNKGINMKTIFEFE